MSYEHNNNPKNNPLQILLKYWPILAFIVALIITWTNFQTTDAAYGQRIGVLETKAQTADVTQNQILIQLSQIQTDLAWIKNKLK